MTSTATHSRMLEATRPDPFDIPRITVRAVDTSRRIRHLIFADRALTASEWAELETLEARNG